jgi:3-oxocholest-4-en-26-oyl-CoA dehydrogenase beta subunit
MDFSLTEEQRALADLAAKILADRCTLGRLKAIERGEERHDAEVWAQLARAGLLGAALFEEAGGSGGGFVEMCLLLEQQGRRLAMIPLLPTLVSAAMPIARFGAEEQKRRWLPGVVSGASILTAALTEPGADPRLPATQAARDAEGWRLDGLKIGVPFAHLAAAVLVPAGTGGGQVGLFLVDPKSEGVSLSRQETMSFEPQFRMELAGARVGPEAVLGTTAEGWKALDWILDRTVVGLCAIASGACREALRLTAEYATNRKQFGKPIATFQAVGQRLADGYIDNEAVALTMWAAATRLHDEERCDREVATAKLWASDGGNRIAHAALHVHGGISIDVDYPIHRYFNWLKQIELTLGPASVQLERLGDLIAAELG